MAEKVISGLVVHGQFAKIEDGSFDGDKGSVKRQVATLHDPINLQYIKIGALNDDAARMAADLRNIAPGTPVVVSVRVSSSGSLLYGSIL